MIFILHQVGVGAAAVFTRVAKIRVLPRNNRALCVVLVSRPLLATERWQLCWLHVPNCVPRCMRFPSIVSCAACYSVRLVLDLLLCSYRNSCGV